MTAPAHYFDGREMLMLHNMFRREFSLAPELVLGVAAGDEERLHIVTDHIADLAAVLHAHHRGEDANVWPLLQERCGEDVEPIVHLMATQHTDIEKAVSEVDGGLVSWRDGASAEDRDAVTAALRELNTVLITHMATEEEHIVPLMESHITIAEWTRMAGGEAAKVEPQKLILGCGMAMYEAEPEVIDMALTNMPVEVQPVIRQLAAEAFAEHSLLVHGTATPPRSSELCHERSPFPISMGRTKGQLAPAPPQGADNGCQPGRPTE